MEIRRNFITPTPPILEIRRNRVACINELATILKKESAMKING